MERNEERAPIALLRNREFQWKRVSPNLVLVSFEKPPFEQSTASRDALAIRSAKNRNDNTSVPRVIARRSFHLGFAVSLTDANAGSVADEAI